MLASLQPAFNAIEQQRRALCAELIALPEAQLAFRPAPGSWSLPEVAQHLALVDSKVTRALTEKRVTGVRRRPVGDVVIRARMLDLFFISGIRVKMPVKGVAPDSTVPLERTNALWADARTTLQRYLDALDDPGTHAICYRHPVGGHMDIFETLRFIRRHHDHHLRQVARIRSAPGFPATARSAS